MGQEDARQDAERRLRKDAGQESAGQRVQDKRIWDRKMQKGGYGTLG